MSCSKAARSSLLFSHGLRCTETEAERLGLVGFVVEVWVEVMPPLLLRLDSMPSKKIHCGAIASLRIGATRVASF